MISLPPSSNAPFAFGKRFILLHLPHPTISFTMPIQSQPTSISRFQTQIMDTANSGELKADKALSDPSRAFSAPNQIPSHLVRRFKRASKVVNRRPGIEKKHPISRNGRPEKHKLLLRHPFHLLRPHILLVGSTLHLKDVNASLAQPVQESRTLSKHLELAIVSRVSFLRVVRSVEFLFEVAASNLL